LTEQKNCPSMERGDASATGEPGWHEKQSGEGIVSLAFSLGRRKEDRCFWGVFGGKNRRPADRSVTDCALDKEEAVFPLAESPKKKIQSAKSMPVHHASPGENPTGDLGLGRGPSRL